MDLYICVTIPYTDCVLEISRDAIRAIDAIDEKFVERGVIRRKRRCLIQRENGSKGNEQTTMLIRLEESRIYL